MSAAIAILIFEQSYGAGKDSERCSSPDAYVRMIIQSYELTFIVRREPLKVEPGNVMVSFLFGH